MTKRLFRSRRKFGGHGIACLVAIALLIASLYDPSTWLPVLGLLGLLYALAGLAIAARARARGELVEDKPWPAWLLAGTGLLLVWEAWQIATGQRPYSTSRGFSRLLDLAIDPIGPMPVAILAAALGGVLLYAGYRFWRRY